MTPALVLIDAQRDMLAAPTLTPHRHAFTARAAALLDACRDARLPVLHVWTTIRSDDERMPHWRRAGTRICIEGAHGHQPPPPLRPRDGEPVFHKTFFSAFTADGFAERLHQLAADPLILAGVYLHGCIRTTALDAYQRGRTVLIAEDAAAGYDPLHDAVSRAYLQGRAARFMSVDRILATLTDRSLNEPAGAADDRRNQPAARPRTLPAAVVKGRLHHPGGADHLAHASPRRRDETLWRVAVAGRAEVDAAVSAAAAAQRTWRDASAQTRADALHALADRLQAEAEPLAAQIAREIGKPLRQARGEVRFAIDLVHAAVEWASRTHDVVGHGWRCRRDPLGLVAAITPFNNAFAVPLGKLAPSLLFGNALLWKPAPAGSALALRLHELMIDAGFPPGLVSVLCGGRSTAQTLMDHPGVHGVTLTGSSAVGYAAHAVAARRRIPLQAELGGNNPSLVCPDADLPAAARAIAAGAFHFAGQRCTANRRAIVEAPALDAFLHLLTHAAADLAWGDPLDEATTLGPLISPAAVDRVAAAVARARHHGATIISPLAQSPRAADLARLGCYHPPVIIRCDDPQAEIVQEETFGPVLVVQRADSWDHALDLAAGVRQGLAAALFSTSAQRQRDFLRRAPAGILKINQATAGVDAHAPFTGAGASAIGPPEHGPFDAHFYTRPRTIYDDPAAPR